MFNLKEFITKNIVNGVKNGTWSKEYACIMATNYLVKGILNEEDVANIDTQFTIWEESQNKSEQTKESEVKPEELIEESTEPCEKEIVNLEEEEQAEEELPTEAITEP